MDDIKVDDLAMLIQDYRADELEKPLDKKHIKRWLSQFEEACRDTILDETIYIFTSWYFNKKKISSFYHSVIEYLIKKYSFTVPELFENIVFLSVQQKGSSQRTMMDNLSELVWNEYEVHISNQITKDKRIYVYIDDALYTGNNARRDLGKILSQIPNGSDLNMLYLLGATYNKEYVEYSMKDTADENSINLTIMTYYKIENRRRFEIEFDAYGNETRLYSNQQYLWPEQSAIVVPEVKEFIDSKVSDDKKRRYLYRDGFWLNDPGIFTSVYSRRIVESEFLNKGIGIAKRCQDNGLYPLGFNNWPPFGFGSFCATYMNISNTCPLVLWWGNIEKKGDTLDYWYPLLPRRVNEKEKSYENDTQLSYHASPYYYNTCPDCGRPFGHEEDGGNGYCIECAMKH